MEQSNRSKICSCYQSVRKRPQYLEPKNHNFTKSLTKQTQDFKRICWNWHYNNRVKLMKFYPLQTSSNNWNLHDSFMFKEDF